MKNKTIYNCHIHTFTMEDVPRKFLPLGLVRILSTKVGFKLVAKALNFLNPLSSDDKFKKYAQFANIGKLESQEKIFNECAKYYPEDSKFIVLAIDMRHMDAGTIPRHYAEQLVELENLYNKYPEKVIPFVHIDPQNLDTFESEVDYIPFFQCNEWVKGVKLYPPIGHYPNDYRLRKIYGYCEINSLPVIAHCGPVSPTHRKSSKKEICKLLDVDYNKFKHESKMELCARFAHPLNYIPVLDEYPNLKVCFAHWGSEISWKEYMENPNNKLNWLHIINGMMRKYPNLYTDVSFSLNNQEYFSILKILLLDETINDRILFGSDFYMVQSETSEKTFSMDLRAYLGEDLWNKIAHENPKRFLSK